MRTVFKNSFGHTHTHTHSLFAELRISYNQNTAPQVSSALSFRALIMPHRPHTSQNSAKVLNHTAALSVFFCNLYPQGLLGATSGLWQ